MKPDACDEQMVVESDVAERLDHNEHSINTRARLMTVFVIAVTCTRSPGVNYDRNDALVLTNVAWHVRLQCVSRDHSGSIRPFLQWRASSRDDDAVN